jgi:hypothetical protein
MLCTSFIACNNNRNWECINFEGDILANENGYKSYRYYVDKFEITLIDTDNVSIYCENMYSTNNEEECGVIVILDFFTNNKKTESIKIIGQQITDNIITFEHNINKKITNHLLFYGNIIFTINQYGNDDINVLVPQITENNLIKLN